MSVEVKLVFSTVTEAAAFLAATLTATVIPVTETKSEKPVKAKDKPGSIVTPLPETKVTPPAETEVPALEYAPLAERITGAIAASNPNSAANRVALKALFAKLAEAYGTPVKTGSDIKAADRGKLAAVLDEIAPAAAEDAMS